MAFNGLPSYWRAKPHGMDTVKMAIPADAWAVGGTLTWMLDRESLKVPGKIKHRKFLRARGSGFRAGRLATGCLAHFVALADAPDEAIAKFAREWGVLGFCEEHRRPGIHKGCKPEHCDWIPDEEGEEYLRLRRIDTAESPRKRGDKTARFLVCRDRTDDWRALARQLRAIQEVALAASQDKPFERTRWDSAMVDLPPGLLNAMWRGSPTAASWLSPNGGLAATISLLLNDGQIQPDVVWSRDNSRFELALTPQGTGSRLFGEDSFVWPVGSLYQILAAQLVHAVTLGQLVQCSWCDAPFDWTESKTYKDRSPRADKGAYCTEFHRREARRVQKAAWKRNRDKIRREQRKGNTDGK